MVLFFVMFSKASEKIAAKVYNSDFAVKLKTSYYSSWTILGICENETTEKNKEVSNISFPS